MLVASVSIDSPERIGLADQRCREWLGRSQSCVRSYLRENLGNKMNVILVSSNLLKAGTLTLTGTNLTMLSEALLFVIIMLVMGFNYLSLRYADKIDSPSLRSLVIRVKQEEHQKNQSYLRDSLNAMAFRMGQMQTQLLRLWFAYRPIFREKCIP